MPEGILTSLVGSFTGGIKALRRIIGAFRATTWGTSRHTQIGKLEVSKRWTKLESPEFTQL